MIEAGVFVYVLTAFVAVVVGAVPFGPVNLSVVNIALHESFAKSMNFALASSFVEVGLVLVAIFFGSFVEMVFADNPWVQVLIFSVFIGLGIFNLVRTTHPKLGERSKLKVSEFVQGFVISAANPQVILFWIFAIAYINHTYALHYSGTYFIIFLLVVFLTKMLVLYLFAKLAEVLKDRLKKSCRLINRTLGTVLLIVGLIQAYKYFAL